MPSQSSRPNSEPWASGGKRFTGVARLLDKLVFVALLVLIVAVEIPYGTVDPWWEAVFECAVFTLTAFWICEGAFGGNWRIRKLWIILPLILITGYAFLQTIEWPFIVRHAPIPQNTLTIDKYQTQLTASKALGLTLFIALLIIHTSTVGRLRWLVRVVIGVGLASALFGIARQLLQSPTSWGFGLPYLFPGVGYAQFIGSNGFSYLMEITFALIAGLVLGGGVPRNRIPAYLAAALVTWGALVLSNSRAGIVSFACQCIFLLFISLNWYFRRKRMRAGVSKNALFAFFERSVIARVLAIALMAGLLLAGALWMGGDRLASKFQQQASSQGINEIDGTTRTQIWHSTWPLIKENLWTGVGFGAYFLAIPHYLIGSGRIKVDQAHNDYLDLLASGGIIACALAAWFIGSILWRARFILRSADVYRRAACLAGLAGMVDVGVHSVVDFGLQITGIAIAFAALLTIVSVRREKTETTLQRL